VYRGAQKAGPVEVDPAIENWGLAEGKKRKHPISQQGLNHVGRPKKKKGATPALKGRGKVQTVT